jgi:hypothetical protein
MISVKLLVMPAAATLLTVLAAGCASAAPAAALASHTASAAASHPAASASPSVTSPAGADIYFAESQDATGTTAHAPGCTAGCPLSGDGTTVLWDMTWPTWTGSEAVGTGTEKIDACDPDCAAGPDYSVAVTVTFTRPARDCALDEWFWTHASFTWPDGLPSALTGTDAPINPWDFTQLKATATQSCR